MTNARAFSVLCAAAAALVIAGCSNDGTTATTAALFDDSTSTLDVATSAGDAAATMVQVMKDDDSTSGVSSDVAVGPSALMSAANPINTLNVTRVRTCYDATGAVVANCSPLSTVRTILTHVTADGTRGKTDSTTGGSSATWSGSVHRVANDSATRIFVGTTETSRVHNNTGTAHDTTLFTENTTSRTNAETAHDSVKAVTFNLPRSSNPFPVSGMITRLDSVHVAIVKTNKSETKDLVRTVEIDFPADAQGNVVMKINAKTCNLNLVTHRVTLCH